VARLPNEDGLDQTWLWNNLKRYTKIVIWDDAGREIPYPADDTLLYYNPDGGQYYHSYANCASVRSKYLPLTAFTYAELDTGIYADLEPCPSCTPVKRKSVIDKENLDRGVITEAEYEARIASHQAGAAQTAVVTADTTTVPSDGDSSVDATTGDVEVILIPADGGE
jgi:hypothetical protein